MSLGHGNGVVCLPEWGAPPPPPELEGGFEGIPERIDLRTGRQCKYCPLHRVPAWRHEQDGRVYYAHAYPDRTWCYGRRDGKHSLKVQQTARWMSRGQFAAFQEYNAFCDQEEVTDSRSGLRYKVCPVDGQKAWRRERSGYVWYSHRLRDGQWCHGYETTEQQETQGGEHNEAQ